MYTTEEGEKISRAEMMASMLSGQGSSKFSATARPIVLRIPETTLAEVDAMAKLAGKSRNSICVELFGVAIEAVRESLSDDVLLTLNEKTTAEYVQLDSDTEDRVSVKG